MKRLFIVSIALVALVGSALGLHAAESDTFTDAAVASGTYKRPQLLVDGINGEHEDNGMAPVAEPVLAGYRPKGASWGWMAVPGIGHERDGQQVLAMPMLDAAVRLRYPADGDVRKGPVKLKPVNPKSGWIADNTI
jgi:hypothetical protein